MKWFLGRVALLGLGMYAASNVNAATLYKMEHDGQDTAYYDIQKKVGDDYITLTTTTLKTVDLDPFLQPADYGTLWIRSVTVDKDGNRSRPSVVVVVPLKDRNPPNAPTKITIITVE